MNTIRFGGTHIINRWAIADEAVRGLEALAQKHDARIVDYQAREPEEAGGLVIVTGEGKSRADKEIVEAVRDAVRAVGGRTMKSFYRFESSNSLPDERISEIAGDIWDA